MDPVQSDEQANSQSRVVLDLIAMLDANREEIATAWAHAMRQAIPHSRYGQYPVHQISAYNLIGLDILKDFLLHPEQLVAQRELTNGEPLPSLVRAGITVSELLQAAWVFLEVILPYVSRTFASPILIQEAIASLDASLRRLLLNMAENYAVETNRLILEQHRRTQLVLEMTRQASRTLELDEVLRQVAGGIISAVGAHHCLIHLMNEEGNVSTLWVATDGFPAPALKKLKRWLHRPIPLSESLFPRLLAKEKRPLVCRDVESDSSAIGRAGRALGARSILGVPCMLDGRLLAAAIALSFKGPLSLADDQVELAWGIASSVVWAIENARLHHKVEDLAIMEERVRLAQEMHDNLAQTLGALQFRASIAGYLLSSEQYTEARDSVAELQHIADRAYTDVREAIFDLRSMTAPGSGFLASFQEYLASYQKHHDIQVHLQADETAADVLRGAAGLQVLRVVQEALTNARKHGHASRAGVAIERAGRWIRICVEDDGQGFDPASAFSDEQEHYGLRFMRERVEKLGGRLQIDSEPGTGTRVTLHVPYSRRWAAA